MTELPRPSAAGMLLRSLLLQGGWNFERMQNLGFWFLTAPALDRAWPDGPLRQAAHLRHLEYFNTHPFMAGFCSAAVGRMETELAAAPKARRPELEAAMRQMKAVLASSCAALGDSFFWGTLRPACAALAMASWGVAAVSWRSTVPPGTAVPAWVHLVGPALYLAVFNAAALGTRWIGVSRGWAPGAEVARELKSLPLRRWGGRIRLAGFTLAAAAGALVAAFAAAHGDHFLLVSLLLVGLLRWAGFANTAIYTSSALLLAAVSWMDL